MKSNAKNPRASFRDLCRAAVPEILARLEARALMANRIAKSAVTPSARERAYSIKASALSQGIEAQGFTVRSDDQGRHHVVRVEMTSGRVLHMQVGALTDEARHNPSVIATLGLTPGTANLN
jgi:hypothetical protein